jgi:hypothetical protein
MDSRQARRRPGWRLGHHLLVTAGLADAGRRTEPPDSAQWDCATATTVNNGAAQRLLIGPPMSDGAVAHGIDPGARTVSAALLLDPELARDDRALFENRILFVGATHASSGDLWLTTGGAICGKAPAQDFASESLCDRAIAWNPTNGTFEYAPTSTVRMIE